MAAPFETAAFRGLLRVTTMCLVGTMWDRKARPHPLIPAKAGIQS
jgi:hypothetical protein